MTDFINEMKLVGQTDNHSLMFHILLFPWMINLMQSPNFVGVPMGILQLVLYCIYRRSDGAAGKRHGSDQEKGLKAAAAMPGETKPEGEGEK
jgi:hypothetical protein